MSGIYARPNLTYGKWEVVAIDGDQEVYMFEAPSLEDAICRLAFEKPNHKFGIKIGELAP